MKLRVYTTIVALVTFTLTSSSTAYSEAIVFGEINEINQLRPPDTGEKQKIISGLDVEAPDAIGIFPDIGKVYWLDHDLEQLRRSSLNGSNAETLLSGIIAGAGIHIDPQNSKIYFTHGVQPRRISRCDADGSNLEDIILSGGPPGTGPLDLVVDHQGNTIYWTDSELGSVERADLDGTNRQSIAILGISSGGPHGIGADFDDGFLFVVNRLEPSIRRLSLDGSENFIIVDSSEVSMPVGLDVDFQNKKIYWADPGLGIIHRANYDGSSVEDIITQVPTALDVAFFPDQEPEELEEDTVIEDPPTVVAVVENDDGTADVTIELQDFSTEDEEESENSISGGPSAELNKGSTDTRYVAQATNSSGNSNDNSVKRSKTNEITFSSLPSGTYTFFYSVFQRQGLSKAQKTKRKARIVKKIKKAVKRGQTFKKAVLQLKKKTKIVIRKNSPTSDEVEVGGSEGE